MAFTRIPGISVEFKTACDELNKLTGKVGWFESAVYRDGTPVAYVATIQEFGSPEQGIPARPFMRTTASDKEAVWKKYMADGANAALQGKVSAREAMELIAASAAGDVKRTISRIADPPLNPATIKARLREKADKKTVGSLTKPLVDTGLLIQSLTSVVEDQ